MQEDRSAAYTGEGLAEDRGQEHIGIAGMDSSHVQPHLLHNLNAVHEGEDDPLLRSTEQVRTGVLGETETMDGATAFLVAEHPLRAVAERQNAYSGATDGRLGCLFVHLSIRQVERHVAVHP